MAKKISHVAATLALALAAACAGPSDQAAEEAWEKEKCSGAKEAPCPRGYCTCWSHPEMCRCPDTCACFRQHGK